MKKVPSGERRDQILKFINENPNCRLSGIARYCKQPSSTIKGTVDNLVEDGEVRSEELFEKTSLGGRRKFYRYFPVKK